MDTLKSKKALVMGGSKGLGFACAERFAQMGAKELVLLARSIEDLETASEKLTNKYDVTVKIHAVDITDQEAFDNVLSQHTDSDILLGNCGGPPVGNFESFELEQWDAAYQGQIRSAVQACQALVPPMARRGWGRLIMIASISVGMAYPGLVLSNSLRPGLLGLARSLSKEYAANGVTANLVCPGLTLTDRLENVIQKNMELQGKTREEMIAGMTHAIPADRLGKPEEIGATAGFLASEGAAFMTGQALFVDGGQTC